MLEVCQRANKEEKEEEEEEEEERDHLARVARTMPLRGEYMFCMCIISP